MFKVIPFFRAMRLNDKMDVPECYGTLSTDLNELIVLEDLQETHFYMINRHTQRITSNNVIAVLKSLAKIHAISYAGKVFTPTKFKKLRCMVKELVFDRQNRERQFFRQ